MTSTPPAPRRPAALRPGSLRLSVLLLLVGALVLPGTALAKKKKEPPPGPRLGGDVLESLVLPSAGSFSRVSSSDLAKDPVLAAGAAVELASIEGPGIIDRLWIVVDGGEGFWRDITLRIYWDGAETPSVEAPLGDFFAVGPGARQALQSTPMSVSSHGRSFTSFWKMPFGKSARVVLANDGITDTRHVDWEVDYRRMALPEGTSYFHARYTQADPPEEGRPFTVLRTSGKGRYVGLSMAAQNATAGPWGEGRTHFLVDGRKDAGPGASSLFMYFGGVFGVQEVHGPVQGCTLDEGDRPGARTSVYRFHLSDPVPFERSFELSLDHGADNKRADRLSAVAYWYQDAPAVPFAELPQARKRRWAAPSDEQLARWRRADELNTAVLDAYRGGRLEDAMTLLEELVGLEPDSPTHAYNLACLYALHDKTDKALHMLEQAIGLGFSALNFARHDSDLAALHGHERFWKLVGGEPRTAQEPSE